MPNYRGVNAASGHDTAHRAAANPELAGNSVHAPILRPQVQYVTLNGRLYTRPAEWTPLLVPFALACLKPATTRSRIISRSNSANTPSIPNKARPHGVDPSIPVQPGIYKGTSVQKTVGFNTSKARVEAWRICWEPSIRPQLPPGSTRVHRRGLYGPTFAPDRQLFLGLLFHMR